MYSKILVPLDGSMMAEKALPYAIALANRCNAKLLVLRAVEVPALTGDTPAHEMEVVANAEEYLKEVKATITSSKLDLHIAEDRLQTLVVYGNAVEQIVEMAPFEKADLVLMTTHGRSGLSRLVMGSVADHVLHRITVPLMLVRPMAQKHDQLLTETMSGIGEPYYNCFAEGKPQNVVLTLDGQDLSESAIAPAVELAQKLGATLHLLSAIFFAPPETISDMAAVSYSKATNEAAEKELVEEAEKYLTSIEEKVKAQVPETVVTVRVGSAAEQITDYALKNNITALVMATHARGEVSHFFMGSVAEEVMRRSHLPVIMVSTRALTNSAAVVSKATS
jgi:nucleotide-binding universal stress UspA family protein